MLVAVTFSFWSHFLSSDSVTVLLISPIWRITVISSYFLTLWQVWGLTMGRSSLVLRPFHTKTTRGREGLEKLAHFWCSPPRFWQHQSDHSTKPRIFIIWVCVKKGWYYGCLKKERDSVRAVLHTKQSTILHASVHASVRILLYLAARCANYIFSRYWIWAKLQLHRKCASFSRPSPPLVIFHFSFFCLGGSRD